MMAKPTAAAPSPGVQAPPRWLLALLAATAGVAVGNIYYCQPLLGLMAATFHTSADRATTVATATQLGYAAGLLLIIPLADSIGRKGLMVGSTLLSVVTLVAMALCSSVRALAVAGFATGTVCMAPQLAVTYAAAIAAPERRGRMVGLVMSGLLIGILLSRTLSGAIAAHAGWRTVYWLAAGVMLGLLATLVSILPPQTPTRRVPYAELLGSLWRLVGTEPILRRHALLGALGFAAFSAFWTNLSFHLASLPPHYGSQTAGAFGLVGAAGALAAAGAGRLAERVGARPLNGAALALVMLSFGLMMAVPASLAGLALGVVGMDAGVQASHISNQTRIYSLAAELRNRLNSIYMVSYFLGGAAGSAAGAWMWTAYGWTGVCLAGIGFAAAGLVVLFADRDRSQRGVSPIP